ncbi:hypothetical protein Tco_0617043 [Tanacetum coccineum]
MSTSKTYQQSFADAGSENRPPMLERGSYIPWASRFRRYLNRKRDNRKWLLKALDEGPYEFKNFIPEGSTIPRLQTTEDLEGNDLLLHNAKIEVMNMILLSIPNEIYNSVDACTSAKDMWKRSKEVRKSHDPLALVANTGSSSRQTSSYYVTHPTSVVDYNDEYQQDNVHNNSEDPLVSVMLLLAKAITQNFSNLTNNHLRASSNTRNQAIIQGDKMLLAKQDETGVILTDEQNDFLFVDASRMKEIEELSANICLMSRIQPADNTSDAGPSYDSTFISEVQSSSNTENEEQIYSTHTKIINSTIGDDQINSDIIFDSPNRNVNSGSIEKDTHVPD